MSIRRVYVRDIPNIMFIGEHLADLTPKDGESIQDIPLIDTDRPVRSAFMLAQGRNRDCIQLLLFESATPDYSNVSDVIARPYIHRVAPGKWGPGLRPSSGTVTHATANTAVNEPVYYVFCHDNQTTYGPVTAIMLAEWLRVGCVLPTDSVCTAGSDVWTDISRSQFASVGTLARPTGRNPVTSRFELPELDDVLDDHIAGMLADIDAVRPRWFSDVKGEMVRSLGISPTNRSFSETTRPPTERRVLPPRFGAREFNGLVVEEFVLAWQFQVLLGFAMEQEYLRADEVQRFLARMVNVADGKSIAAVTACMNPKPITVGDVATTLAAYLVGATSHSVAFENTRDLLERTKLPFLGELTQMKTALAFEDIATATEISERVDPHRRW